MDAALVAGLGFCCWANDNNGVMTITSAAVLAILIQNLPKSASFCPLQLCNVRASLTIEKGLKSHICIATSGAMLSKPPNQLRTN
jgi:hypothetical protein